MRKMHVIAGCAVIAVVFLILVFFPAVYLVRTEEKIISSAMELRINTSEIGMGVEKI